MSPVASSWLRRSGAFHTALVAGLSLILMSGGLPPSIRAADPIPGASQPPGTSAPGPVAIQAAVAGGVITLPRAGTLMATVVSASAAAGSDFGLDQPTHQTLIANATFNVGATAAVGSFAAGTSLVFFLFTPSFGTTYLSTGDHAQVASDGPEAWIISWEDSNDFDFNDLVTRISYAPVAGPPAEQTYGAGSGLHGPRTTYKEAEPVDTATGNYVSQATDLALPGRGLAFAFTRTYNSLDTAVGPLGPGWRASYGAALVLEVDGGVRFIAEDGAQYVYTPDGSGGFVAPAGSTDRLVGVPTGYELRRRDQLRYQFDSTGGLVGEIDRNGNTQTFTYTGANLTAITDTVGRVITLGYDASGRLTSLADPTGRRVTYAYDASGRLATVTDVRGGVTGYAYDAAGRLTTITDQNGHVLVTNTYGTSGRVTEQLDARGDHSTFAWDPATATSTFTDARGGIWTDVYASNKLVARVDPLGNRTTYTYDVTFNRTSVTDPRANTTTFTYDVAGNVLSQTAPASLGYVQAFTYDGANNLLTSTDGRGFTTTNTYDGAGNLRTVTGPGPTNPVTTFTVDATGQLTAVSDPRAKVTSFAYDAQGNRASATSPLGERTTMAYDGAGRLTSLVEPRGNVTGGNPALFTTTFTYDAAGNVLTATDPLGNVTTTTYDPAGNPISSKDALNRTTTSAYDPANHLVSVTDALGGLTVYAYDPTGDLVTRTDAKNHVTAYAYDLAGRMTSTTDPLGNITMTTYDPAGNVATRTDANGKTTTFGYDALNRPTSITYASTSTPSVAFAYDANDNRISMTDGAGTESFAYDSLDRLTSDTRAADTFVYTFDGAGNLLTRTYPDGTVTTHAYDDDGRMVSAASGGSTTTYSYDVAGNLMTTATPDGFVARSTYDRAGRLLEVANTGAAGVLSRFTYALDPVGNRIQMTSTQSNVLYTYDALDRITKVCYASCTTSGGGGGGTAAAPVTAGSSIDCLECGGGGAVPNGAPIDNPPAPSDTFTAWTYDPLGNRLTETNYQGTTTYAYDAADRLTGVTGPGTTAPTGSTYDANGNQLSAGATTYAYDLADRLISATVGTTAETYTWSGDGLRRSAATGAQATKTIGFVVDRTLGAGNVVAERTGSGALLRRYTYGLDLLAQTTSNKGPYWYHHDGLGSVTDITSATGSPLAWTEYTPFGTPRASAATSQAPVNPFRFSGEYQDGSTALYHLRARQYDPTTGRFTSPDPVSPGIGDPVIGAYVYVANNPVRYTDPSGRWTVGVCLSVNFDFFGFGVDIVPVCLVAASSLEVGVISSGGAGGAFGAKVSAGLSAHVSNGDYVEDLRGWFYNVGASAAVGGGVQGSGFGGLGHCNQAIGGGTFGASLGGGAEAHGTATFTQVWGTLGAKPAACPTTSK